MNVVQTDLPVHGFFIFNLLHLAHKPELIDFICLWDTLVVGYLVFFKLLSIVDEQRKSLKLNNGVLGISALFFKIKYRN